MNYDINNLVIHPFIILINKIKYKFFIKYLKNIFN